MARSKIERENDRKVGDYRVYDAKTLNEETQEHTLRPQLAFGRDGTAGEFTITKHSPTEFSLHRRGEELGRHDRKAGAKEQAARIVLSEAPAEPEVADEPVAD